jgi:hypothetical protein
VEESAERAGDTHVETFSKPSIRDHRRFTDSERDDQFRGVAVRGREEFFLREAEGTETAGHDAFR